ncbi:hypothetical protein BJV82DRAFT_519263, partial [Fennellomyces sp. T-0311]
RGLWVKVIHSNNDFDPFYILNIYAPANAGELHAFLRDTMFPFMQSAELLSLLEQSIVLGDFNCSYERKDSSFGKAPVSWRDYLAEHFVNVMTPCEPRQRYILTWYSTADLSTSSSIDYVFLPESLHSVSSSPEIDFLSPAWADHSLVTFSLRCPRATAGGHDIWRANPLLARSKAF